MFLTFTTHNGAKDSKKHCRFCAKHTFVSICGQEELAERWIHKHDIIPCSALFILLHSKQAQRCWHDKQLRMSNNVRVANRAILLLQSSLHPMCGGTSASIYWCLLASLSSELTLLLSAVIGWSCQRDTVRNWRFTENSSPPVVIIHHCWILKMTH